WLTAVAIATAIKERFKNVIVVAGGPHVTLTREEALREAPAFDYAVLSESEDGMRQLVEAITQGDSTDVEKVTGILYRRGDEVRATHPRTLRPDVDNLMFPNRADLDHGKYLFSVPGAGIRKFTTLITSRGCPYNCTFCTE